MDSNGIHRIARSVCDEYGLGGTISVAPHATELHRWRLEIRRDDQPNQVSVVSLFCTPTTSPVFVRDSLKRQLALE
jgi:hypothetical protein